MGTLGLSGLASGVDTGGIVEKLMAIERQSLSRISLSKQRAQARQTGLKDVSAKLSALKSAAAELRGGSLWANVQKLTSSDTTRIGIERLSDSAPGTFSLEVQRLATSTQKTYAYTAANGPSTMDVGGVTVNVAGKATVSEVVTSINGTAGVPVYATNVNGQLVLTSKATGGGTASDFTVTASQLVEDTAKAVAGGDARYTLNGVLRTSASNVVEDAIPGSRLTLKALTASPVTVTVGPAGVDADAVKAKLKTFVEAYNAVVTLTREKLTERFDPKSQTISGQTKGQLYGDPGLNSMLSGLRSAVSEVVAGNPEATDALADLGISTGKTTGGAATPDSVAGKLVFDEAKFTSTMSADPEAVKRLMGAISGVAGISQRIEDLVARQVGTSALLPGRVKSADDEIRRLDSRYADMEKRLATKEKRLLAQFAAMESALQASQTQSAWLSGQLAGLSNS